MARWLTISAVLSVACLFGWAVPLVRLFNAFQPVITALSIMVAAVFVRLNRGMPTLEWKSADPEHRRELTSQIVALSKEYGWIIAIDALVLLGVLTLSVISKEVAGTWPQWIQHCTSGVVGGGIALCASRMAYVIWRDIDVVTLQKRLIDGTATREINELEIKSADEKVAMIRGSGLRKVEISQPKAWGE